MKFVLPNMSARLPTAHAGGSAQRHSLLSRQVFQSSPYVSPDSNRWVIGNATPIVVGGREVAILHFESNLDAVRTQIAAVLAPGMRVRVVDLGLGRVIADSGASRPILADPLAKLGVWRDAAGPVRAAQDMALSATNANRWRVEGMPVGSGAL